MHPTQISPLLLPQFPPLPEDIVTSGEYCEIELSPGATEREVGEEEPRLRKSPHGTNSTQGVCYSLHTTGVCEWNNNGQVWCR